MLVISLSVEPVKSLLHLSDQYFVLSVFKIVKGTKCMRLENIVNK